MENDRVFVRVMMAALSLGVAITFIIACVALDKAMQVDNRLSNLSATD